MATSNQGNSERTYLNPVYGHSFPDPYVLKFRGEYWGYCTGFWDDDRCFGVLHSRDLVNWRALPGAMEPLPIGATCYWAPEVTYDNGRFLMYYSVGNEERMQIRLAVAEDPSGPFIDSGHRLTTEDFAIDPHLFIDSDGSRYLFYATDFLEHTHIGTGTVVDRLIDEVTLEGHPQTVTRARHEWQLYDPMRVEKGGVRWYTVEGPFVLKHKDLYCEMFSAGNWKNVTYGVSYATSRRIDSPEEWEQASDGVHILPILRTIPGLVIGPGHNSAVRGPDNLQEFCIYHRWDTDVNARVLAIDRLDWAGKRMFVDGPSTTPQPLPNAPAVWEFYDDAQPGALEQKWACTPAHAWQIKEHEVLQVQEDGEAEAHCKLRSPCFVAELSLRKLTAADRGGYGIALCGAHRHLLRFLLVPGTGAAVVSLPSDNGWIDTQIPLPQGFKPETYHLLRIEVDGPWVSIHLDNVAVRWHGRLDEDPLNFSLLTDGTPAAFAGVAMTVGWEDLFMTRDVSLLDRGWVPEGATANWYLEDNQLWCTNLEDSVALISKGPALQSYELVVNARLHTARSVDRGYEFLPAWGTFENGPVVTVVRSNEGWILSSESSTETRHFPLPAGFDPGVYQQFRFRKEGGRLIIQYESEVLGEVTAPAGVTQVGLCVKQATAAFDMVRVTGI